MDYNDIWFLDTTNQARNFRRYTIWFILLFIIVTVGSIVCVKSMYKSIERYEVIADNPIVRVTEAKATNANGYIKGEVKNPGETEIKGKYIKFEFYTENDINVGQEYVEIGDLAPAETKTYEAKFRFSNVERFIVTITNKKE